MKSKLNRDRLILLGLCIVLWEMVARWSSILDTLFPSVGTILMRFLELLRYEGLMFKTFYSVGVVMIAVMLSLIIATFMILLGCKVEFAKNNICMMHAILSPLPGVAILPLVILWMGVGIEAMLFILIHATVWPLWSQLNVSVEDLQQRYWRFEKAYRLPYWRKFFHIYVQGSKPELLSALSVAWSRGWRALISIEMIFGMVGRYSGLGWLIFERRMYMDTAGLYATLLAIAGCGIIFESILFTSKRIGVPRETTYKNNET